MINQQLNYGAALFFAIIILAVGFCQITSRKYDASNAQVAGRLHETALFSYADLHRILTVDESNDFIIIDLRPSPSYDAGHIPGAISIPKEALLDRNHHRTLKSSKTLLLYAEREHYAVAAQALLFSMGHEEVRVIPGSFETITENVLEDFNPRNAFYSSDKARFDFPRFMSVQAIQPTK